MSVSGKHRIWCSVDSVDSPDALWVANMTYVPTWSGFIYLVVVLDAWSRRVVGWSIGEQMNTDLVLGARPSCWCTSTTTLPRRANRSIHFGSD